MSNQDTEKFKEYTRMGKDTLYLFIGSGIYSAFKSSFKLFIILLAGSIYKADNLSKVILCIIIMVALLILFSHIAKYFSTAIKVDDKNVYIKVSILSTNITTIPIENIYAIRTKRNLFHRIVEMQRISFDTLANKNEEVELYMNDEDTTLLLDCINQYRTQKIGLNTPHSSSSTPTTDNTTFKYSLWQLIKGAAIQNIFKHFGVLLLGAFTFLGNYYDYAKWIDLDAVMEKISKWIELSPNQYLFILIIFSYLFAVAIWCIIIIMRQYGLSITLTSDTLLIEQGLFTHRSSQITKDKIVSISFKKNWLENYFGLYTMYIHQASNAEEKKRKNKLVFYGWAHTSQLLQWWLGETNQYEMPKTYARWGVFYRAFAIKSLIFIVIFSFFLLIPEVKAELSMSIWTLVGCCLLIYTLVSSFMDKMKRSISVSTNEICLHSGVWENRQTYIPMHKLEKIELVQSIFQKHFNSASLVFVTKEHTYKMRSISLNIAEEIRDYAIYKMEVEKV